MKKLVLVLVLALIAAPSFGALELTLTRDGSVVTLGYAGAETANLPRAFGLTVSVSGAGTVTDINNYKQGESTAAAPGFGIYPATIDINAVTGAVSDYGTPLAVTGAPGAGDQELPSNSFVVEFGSLYAGDDNEPDAPTGTLCKFNVNPNGADVTLTVGEEDTYRGGVVFEDGTTPATALTASIVVPVPGCSPMPVAATTPTPTNGAVGVSMFPTQPTLSWTPAAGGTNPKYDVYFGTTSPGSLVSTNQTATSYTVSGAVQGQTYYWKVVSKNDCNAVGVSSAVWSFNTDCFVGGTAGTGEYAKWVEYGKPSCWCFKKQCRGDADGKKTALKPVANPDLVIFKEAFNKSKAVVKTLVVTGVPGICADFDHKDSALKPVANPDLLIYKEYFNDADGTVPVCNAAPVITGPVNFWTN